VLGFQSTIPPRRITRTSPRHRSRRRDCCRPQAAIRLHWMDPVHARSIRSVPVRHHCFDWKAARLRNSGAPVTFRIGPTSSSPHKRTSNNYYATKCPYQQTRRSPARYQDNLRRLFFSGPLPAPNANRPAGKPRIARDQEAAVIRLPKPAGHFCPKPNRTTGGSLPGPDGQTAIRTKAAALSFSSANGSHQQCRVREDIITCFHRSFPAPALVFLDLQMPRMGIDFRERSFNSSQNVRATLGPSLVFSEPASQPQPRADSSDSHICG